MAVVAPGGCGRSAGCRRPMKAPPPPKVAGRRYDGTALLFLGPTAILMAIFLIYPTIYTIALSFNRGRRGEFNEWVGLTHYIGLLTRQELPRPEHVPAVGGAIWNNVLWAIFYTSVVIFLGLIVAVLASRVRYESIIKAVVFLPMAIAATALAIIWNFVYAPDAEYRPAQRDPRPLHRARDLVAGQPVTRQCGAHHRGHLGVGRLRDGHPVGGAQEHPERGPRGGADRRRERAADLLPGSSCRWSACRSRSSR